MKDFSSIILANSIPIYSLIIKRLLSIFFINRNDRISSNLHNYHL